MLKPTTLFLLLTMLVTGTLYGQTLSASSTNSAADSSADGSVALKESIARETAKHKSSSAEVDAKEMEKIQRQVPQSNWNTKKVVLVTALVVALVGLVAVIAYNSKRCIKRDPSGCDFVNDINCKCLEYTK